VVELTPLVASLARSILDSEPVRRASGQQYWRESYVGMIQEDGTLLEGFVDLMYRENDGHMVIVDYKTDDVPAAAIPSRVAFYRPQLAAYREAVAAADGQPRRSLLIFAGTTAARTVEVLRSDDEPAITRTKRT